MQMQTHQRDWKTSARVVNENSKTFSGQLKYSRHGHRFEHYPRTPFGRPRNFPGRFCRYDYFNNQTEGPKTMESSKMREKNILRSCLGILISVFMPMVSSAEQAVPIDAKASVFFEKKIRPVFANNCFNCHSADNKAAVGLRVDDFNGLLAGGSRTERCTR